MKKSFFLIVSLILIGLHSFAQQHIIYNDRIKSLQVIANNNWQDLPIIEINNGVIAIDFDDLTHEYHRYTYTIEHCSADWSTSKEIFESDFIEGFADGNTIEDVAPSLLTNTNYTHYRIEIPNTKCKPLLSGNYQLTVYDENQSPAILACFMITEPSSSMMPLGMSVTTNTDIGFNQYYQQVEMSLQYGKYKVTDFSKQITTVLMKNKDLRNAIYNSKPQYILNDGVKWTHNKDFIFNAENEYRKFEILSTDVATMGVEKIFWDGKNFNATLFPCLPKPNYLYDKDANGAFLLRNSNNYNSQTESDYILVHFTLYTDKSPQNNIYIDGDWTINAFSEQYKMDYDSEKKCYTKVIPLKLGYYNYRFLTQEKDGKTKNLPSEGNFYQTENKYQALIYYRELGGRYDKLVGYKNYQYIP